MLFGESLRFSLQALRANPVRSLLTGLGMVIGTASVILVVTISLTSRDYILEQVQGIGSNIIFGYYVTAGPTTATSDADYIKMADVEAIRKELQPDIVAATGVMAGADQILVGGRPRDVKIIGSDEAYASVRNTVVTRGRFMDAGDTSLRQKVALLTDSLAERMFGSTNAALNQTTKLFGLQFTVIGTFHEKVETFGQSELERDTILIPITVLRYFTPVERIDPLYVQVRSANEVDRVAERVREVISGRHRPGATYRIETLTAILNAAKNISLILSLVLILVSAITLVISGIGIMNIMLVSVTERTREIGVRKAIGARRDDIIRQFLFEAIVLSEVGGLAGILFGVAGGNGVAFLWDMSVVFPWGWALTGLIVCSMIGIGFGWYPAWKASRLEPVDALRYE
jgi:putative ABC transport system permease protein